MPTTLWLRAKRREWQGKQRGPLERQGPRVIVNILIPFYSFLKQVSTAQCSTILLCSPPVPTTLLSRARPRGWQGKQPGPLERRGRRVIVPVLEGLRGRGSRAHQSKGIYLFVLFDVLSNIVQCIEYIIVCYLFLLIMPYDIIP